MKIPVLDERKLRERWRSHAREGECEARGSNFGEGKRANFASDGTAKIIAYYTE